MRRILRILRSPDVRIGALLLACIAVYPTAYLLLPRTADGVSVTVVQCTSVQPAQYPRTEFDCQGPTVFGQTFTDEATVSAVHATLDGLHEYVNSSTEGICNAAGSVCAQTRVYTFDLLWHGIAVKSYRASVHGGYPTFWDATTLGVELTTTEGSTTWQDLTRLTGMPVESITPP
jgi:hypothetical protein